MGTLGSDSKATIRLVKKVQFGILSPDEIRRMSLFVFSFRDAACSSSGSGRQTDHRVCCIDLRFHQKSSDLHIECGYKVERHIRNGDDVLCSRILRRAFSNKFLHFFEVGWRDDFRECQIVSNAARHADLIDPQIRVRRYDSTSAEIYSFSYQITTHLALYSCTFLFLTKSRLRL